MITKQKVLHSLQDMPDQFSIDDLMEKLLVIEKIERGLAQAEKGAVYSMEEARQTLTQWPK